MRSYRPPCGVAGKTVMLLLLLSGSVRGFTDGINLPDLVLSRSKKPDIPQMDDYADVSAEWTAAYPRSRRLYSLELQSSEPLVKESMDPGDFGNPDVLITAANESNLPPPTDSSSEKRHWNASVRDDVREGVDFEGDIAIGSPGTVGVEIFMPFGLDVVRPAYAGFAWERKGNLSWTAWTGGRDESGLVPAGQIRLHLDRGLETIDSHSVGITGFGGKEGGGSFLWGSRFDIPLEESHWFLKGEIGAGAWINSEEGSWLADGGVGVGIRIPEYRFRALLGLSGGLYGSEPYLLAPMLSLSKKAGDLWMFSFEAGLEQGYEAQADEVLKKHKVGEFDASLPMSTFYGVGIGIETENGSILDVHGKGGYGKYSFSTGSSFVTRSDVRFSTGLDFIIPVKDEQFKTQVTWSNYTQSGIQVWTAALVQTAGQLEFQITSGSEDEILGAGMPGIRGEQPIIGLGINWTIGPHWYVGSLFYARMPWEDPSMVITIARRDK